MPVPFFRSYEHPIIATIQLLRQLKVKVTDSSVNETILSHPNYPSLLSISDCLKQWQVENAAINVEKERIDEMPLPFIAYVRREFKTVTQITDSEIWFLNDDNKIQKQDKQSFLDTWSGIALLAEPKEEAGEKEYALKKKKESMRTLPAWILAGCGLLWTVVTVVFLRETNAYLITSYIALLLCKMMGITVSGLLLWYEVDKYNPTLQKICTSTKGKMNCNFILNSNKAKIFSWLSWSEVGFFYFAGGFLALSLIPESLYIIIWLNIFALPYIIFSIYFQGFVVKQWCRLCLTVQVLLLCEFVIGLTRNMLLKYQFLTTISPNFLIIQPILLFMLPVAVWYFLKPHLLKEYEGKTKKYELARLKNNTDIFNSLLTAQKQVTQNTEGLGIILGNPHAANTLIKVCNPYCKPCAKAHSELETLLANFSNLKIQIIFTVSTDPDDHKIPPVRHLLAIFEKGDEKVTKQALIDWYSSEDKNYDDFATKYKINGVINEQNKKLQAMVCGAIN
jgi:uncharacterized membrane protein